MNLSPHFTLEEMLHSETAEKLKIENRINAEEVNNLVRLCTKVLEPLRAHFGTSIHINSGTHSYKEIVRSNYKAQGINRVQQEVDIARDEAFREYETMYEGEEKSIADFQQIPILRALCPRTVRRLVQDRGYKSVKRGVYIVHSPLPPRLEAA